MGRWVYREGKKGPISSYFRSYFFAGFLFNFIGLIACMSVKYYDEEITKDIPESRLLVTDEAHASALISDAGAKSLLRKSEVKIKTRGDKRAVVNIDVISAVFKSGERVDINSMKEKGLIPEDCAYVKVLARGVIDKPLTVTANSFSLAAVKMIALTGGKAVIAKTQRIK